MSKVVSCSMGVMGYLIMVVHEQFFSIKALTQLHLGIFAT